MQKIAYSRTVSRALLPASQSTAPPQAKVLISNAQRDADDLKRTREEEDTIHEREEKRAKGGEDDDDMDMDEEDDDDGQSFPSPLANHPLSNHLLTWTGLVPSLPCLLRSPTSILSARPKAVRLKLDHRLDVLKRRWLVEIPEKEEKADECNPA